ncbi:MAG: hypothetical protein ABIQ88_19940 [Chitinophagaceae bacterium]
MIGQALVVEQVQFIAPFFHPPSYAIRFSILQITGHNIIKELQRNLNLPAKKVGTRKKTALPGIQKKRKDFQSLLPVTRPGFEPRHTEPESVVLPLYYRASCTIAKLKKPAQ